MPPIHRVFKVRRHQVTVETLSVARIETHQVDCAPLPSILASVEEFCGAVVDQAVREDFVFPFGEPVHQFQVLGLHPGYHGWYARVGICWRGDEFVKSVAEDYEAFFVGQ